MAGKMQKTRGTYDGQRVVSGPENQNIGSAFGERGASAKTVTYGVARCVLDNDTEILWQNLQGVRRVANLF
jgi:hypothetical protein